MTSFNEYVSSYTKRMRTCEGRTLNTAREGNERKRKTVFPGIQSRYLSYPGVTRNKKNHLINQEIINEVQLRVAITLRIRESKIYAKKVNRAK